MILYDKKTGLKLGNPEDIPLSAKQGGLPTNESFYKECSSMILSASGWRKVFAISGDEEDSTEEIGAANTAISALIAAVFADYILQRCGKNCKVAVGIDARPTGGIVADTMLRVLAAKGVNPYYLFITAAPEIMAYSRNLDGFVYISASHNPIGHNGIKFGLNDGGVLPGTETAKLTESFKTLCASADSLEYAAKLVAECPPLAIEQIYSKVQQNKEAAVAAYATFTRQVVSGTKETTSQETFFETVKAGISKTNLDIVCDMNGSARTLSIDSDFLSKLGIGFHAINNKPRQIAHTIIPEPENLIYCAKEMALLKPQNPAITLGYMPDCDGDRGNIVYWDEANKKPEVLKAQEVFALSVLAELAYLDYKTQGKVEKVAVAVNDPTSMRIEEIACAFGAKVFRAEVGEANVVNLARELREKGYQVPILGEGSNGGNITHPAAVRDPLNTIFALIKLLVIKDEGQRKGLFHLWCEKTKQTHLYKSNFTLTDIIATLPRYTTTGVSEERALLKIKTTDHSLLKKHFQNKFEESWEQKKCQLKNDFGICSYQVICNNGTKETKDVTDYSISGRGGLKLLFKNCNEEPIAFIWMRGSGTEPVFRILCDVKGINPQMEATLLEWETELLHQGDAYSNA